MINHRKIFRTLIIILTITFLSAGCNFLSGKTVGGFIKTANGGADWQFANNVKDEPKSSTSSLSISSMAFDPKNVDHIFAGSYNNGVFESDDGGSSWRRILSKFLVYDIIVHPLNSDIIYAAGAFGDHGRVVVTRDGGKSWNEFFNEASVGNVVRSITINPNNAREVVIGMDGGAIIKSDDEGVNWRLLQTYNSRINKLKWQSNNSLLAILRNSGLYKSTDNGNSFVNITDSINSFNGFVGDLISRPRIANFNQVAVSKTNPNEIVISTNSGLYKTVNGGQAWLYLSLPVQQTNIETLGVNIADTNETIIYASAGSNMYRSGDGGVSWQAQNTNSTGRVNIILVNPNNPQIVYAGIFIP